MSKYTELLEFFMQNGISLNKDQMEILKETTSNFTKIDKVSWQIDGGVSSKEVIEQFKFVYGFLNKNGLLTEEGKELYRSGIDESSALTSQEVTPEGIKFLKKNYSKIIKIFYNSYRNKKPLDYKECDKLYKEFKTVVNEGFRFREVEREKHLNESFVNESVKVINKTSKYAEYKCTDKPITESMSKKSYGDATEITVDKKDDPRGIKYSLGGDIDGKTDMVEQRPDGSFKIKNISSKTADYLRSKAVEKD